MNEMGNLLSGEDSFSLLLLSSYLLKSISLARAVHYGGGFSVSLLENRC